MKDFLDWADTKYRPQSFDEVVGNEWAVKKIIKYAKTGNFPHLLFCGPAGVGKSVCAEILGKETGAEFQEWNASDQRTLKDVRAQIGPYAMTVPLNAPFKIAFLDECENLHHLAQPALRRIMEKYSGNCRFVLSSNFLYSIIYPVRSRCFLIRFRKLTPEEVFEGLSRVVKAEDLFDIINEKQGMIIAESVDGDMRMAVKALQAICEGADSPISDEDVNALVPMKPIEGVITMLRMALDGKFVDSVNKFIEIASIHTQREIFECIERLFIYGNKKFSKNEMVNIAVGLGRITEYMLGERKSMYAFLAHLGQGR